MTQQPPDNFLTALLNEMFEDHPLALFEWKGVIYFVAKQVGAILGYANDGHKMVEQFDTSWASEIEDKRHRVTFSGPELAMIKEAISHFPDGSGESIIHPRSPSLTVLTKEGLYQVLALTNKPVGRRLRAWLSAKVLPTIERTGSYTDPAAIPATTGQPAAGAIEHSPERFLVDLGDRFYRHGETDHALLLYAKASEMFGIPFTPKALAETAPAPKQLPDAKGARPSRDEIVALLRRWWIEYTTKPNKPAVLAFMASRYGLLNGRISPSRHGGAIQMGRILKPLVGQVVDGFRIVRSAQVSGSGCQYHIERVQPRLPGIGATDPRYTLVPGRRLPDA